jgi:hypothetical protein
MLITVVKDSGNISEPDLHVEVIKGTPTNGVKKIEGVIKGTGNTKVATSCHGNVCSIEGQFCPPTVPGSGGAGYCCKNKKWYSGSCKA